MLKRAFRKVRYGILLARIVGLKGSLHHLRRQIYSRTTYIGVEKNLDTDIVHVPSRIEYTLQPASEEDMEEVLQKAKSASRESAYELIQRKWFYESGFHNCYVARTADTGELCYIQWLITPEDNGLVSRDFEGRFPRLKENEIRLENAFTFEEYRGNRILPSAEEKLSIMARDKGFKRMIIYILQDNTASVKTSERAGSKKFGEIRELKLFFFTKRRHNRC